MRKLALVICMSFIGIFFLNSCKKKFEEPAVKTVTPVSGTITIDSIYKRYSQYYLTSFPKPTQLYKFTSDLSLECVVTADETSGNIYKTVFVEDLSGALQIKLVNAGGLYVGDKIRINLNGTVLDDYGDMVQLDSIDIEKQVVKVSTGNAVTPVKVTLGQLLQFNLDGHTPFQSRLVLIDSVEFAPGSKAQLYADAIGKYSTDHLVKNAFGQQAVLRSSGYSNFANQLTPCGKGKMTVIVGQYKGDLQLTIRDFKEVNLSNENCPVLVSTFNDANILRGGWVNYKVNGNVEWKGGSYTNRNYAQISNYSSGNNAACETWLISPAMNIGSSPNPHFSFESAYNYTGPMLQVLVSTNYSSGDPNAATWINLNPVLSGGSWNWTYSGDISLSACKSPNTRIAFKYTGTNTAGSTWEIDDVAVFGE